MKEEGRRKKEEGRRNFGVADLEYELPLLNFRDCYSE